MVVPVTVGVVTFVFLSEADLPLSLAAVSAGVPGVVGAVMSIVMLVLVDAGPRLPATSVALTVIGLTPVLSAVDVTE